MQKAPQRSIRVAFERLGEYVGGRRVNDYCVNDYGPTPSRRAERNTASLKSSWKNSGGIAGINFE